MLARLLGDQRMLEHHVGHLGAFVARANEFDAAPILTAILEPTLAATAGVNLRLEDRGRADLVECLLRFRGAAGHDAARHRRLRGRQQLFRLIFVDLHLNYQASK